MSMEKQKHRTILRELEDKGITLAAIGREFGVCRQHVHLVLKGRHDSRRIRAAIVEKLGWNPWPEAGERKLAG